MQKTIPFLLLFLPAFFLLAFFDQAFDLFWAYYSQGYMSFTSAPVPLTQIDLLLADFYNSYALAWCLLIAFLTAFTGIYFFLRPLRWKILLRAIMLSLLLTALSFLKYLLYNAMSLGAGYFPYKWAFLTILSFLLFLPLSFLLSRFFNRKKSGHTFTVSV